MRQLFLLLFCALVIDVTAQSPYEADRHNTSYNTGWLTCFQKISPNPARGNSYWIMYDLGNEYDLGKIHLWNSNIPDHLNSGMKEYEIDYSMDGMVWTNWGSAEAEMASGSAFYTGEEGPDMTGISARFILITIISNHGGDCHGFSEIRIQTNGLSTDVVEVDELEGSMKAQPSIFSDQTILLIEDVEENNYMYRISDVAGKVVLQEQVTINGSKMELPIDGAGWNQGTYFVTLSDGQKLKSIKIQKINP